jgi:hypothetical protein
MQWANQSDSDKLNLLANWFDAKYPDDFNPEIQTDLRRMAKRLDALEILIEKVEDSQEGRNNAAV